MSIQVDERMTSAELRCVMEWLGLNAEALAYVLHVSPRTVRHWLAGKYPIPDGVREEVEAFEAQTATAVWEVVAALRDASDVGVIVHETDAAMWAERPELEPLPAKWWRAVAMRAAHEVPGVTITYADTTE